jgi:hypothetical protein
VATSRKANASRASMASPSRRCGRPCRRSQMGRAAARR